MCLVPDGLHWQPASQFDCCTLMLNEESIRCVSAAKPENGEPFRLPLYGSYCFSRLPATIELLFDAESPARTRALPVAALQGFDGPMQCVILVLLDGFGWKHFDRHVHRQAFLTRFLESGVVSKLTSQFPSTTANHFTTLCTGLALGHHGVPDAVYYHPTADCIINPLLFAFAGESKRETMRDAGLAAADFFPSTTLFQQLARRGIASFVFQHEAFTPSSYSDSMFVGATVHPFANLQSVLARLVESVNARKAGERRYYFLYIDDIDGLSHAHGPDSRTVDLAVASILEQLEQQLWMPLRGKLANTALLLTGDHGQSPTRPGSTFYVNRECPGIEQYLRRNRRQELLRFAGSARNLWLFVQDGHFLDLRDQLAFRLRDRARVAGIGELVKEGLFGPADSEQLLLRLGDLGILPYPGETVYWDEPGKFRMDKLGCHGGLSAEEMETGLYALPTDGH